jgi:hypothetical protein
MNPLAALPSHVDTDHRRQWDLCRAGAAGDGVLPRVPPGHYDITIPDSFGFNGSAQFDLAAGQQAFVKIVFWKTGHDSPRAQTQGFSARLVSEQIAEAEIPGLAAEAGQR